MFLPKSDVGGKGFHLQTMERGGLPVPQFHLLSWPEIQQLFASKAPNFWVDIQEEMLRVFSSYQLDLEEICQLVHQKVLHADVSERAWADFTAKLEQRFGNNYLVSVRSSAIDEDSTHTSFAGQHLTKLFVGPENLQQALKECVASAWSFGAISYRLLHQLPVDNIQFAVVIQTMVNAQKSGIGFSMDITRNLADAIITAGYGLGEGVVSDRVEADTYRINRNTQNIESELVDKQHALQWTAQKSLELVETPAELSKKSCLSPQEIETVFNCMQQCEALLSFPADIEFAFDEHGDFFLLQMRPITTLDHQNIEILDNTNIVESYPGITLPLSFSFAQNAYKRLFENSAKYFWISADWVKNQGEVFNHLIAHPYGRVYYRLDNWYRLTTLVYNSPKAMQAWEKAVGLSQPIKNKSANNPWMNAKIVLAIAWIILRYKRGNKRFFQTFQQNYQRFVDYKKHTSSPAELWPYFQHAMDRTFRHWPLTVVNDFLAFKVFGWLQSLIARWKISTHEEFANELIGGYGEVESEMAVTHLLQLKEFILQNTVLAEAIQDNSKLLAFIENQPTHPFSVAWKEYLDRYGDRTFAELKLETITPKMDPNRLVELLRSQLNSPITAHYFAENTQKVRQQAWQRVSEALSPWNPKYWVFKAVANLAAFGVMSRENMRFCRTRMYGASREIFLQIGNWMHEDGYIVHARDIFYLHTQEVKEYCLYGTNCLANGMTYNQIIRERKNEYQNFESIELPDRILYTPGELPVFQPNRSAVETRDKHAETKRWQGVAVSRGEVEAEAALMIEPNLTADIRGKILISKMTDPGWVFLMSQASALVTEKGSLLSHTAIVGRELGIPVVVAVSGITSQVKSGDKLRVNGATGVVERI